MKLFETLCNCCVQKCVSRNLNDDSPLGLRRILSQSTDSLNFRNRAMSMESLNDEGEVYYAAMLEELEREGKDFEADSWSRAVDPSYLQTHRKDVIKRQDVIYGENTSLPHYFSHFLSLPLLSRSLAIFLSLSLFLSLLSVSLCVCVLCECTVYP